MREARGHAPEKLSSLNLALHLFVAGILFLSNTNLLRSPDPGRLSIYDGGTYNGRPALVSESELQRPSHLSQVNEPDDTHYDRQYNLRAMNWDVLWPLIKNIERNGDEIVIAVLDTGIYAGHPDLPPQSEWLWQDPTEIPNNGIDDDGDGCKDNINGLNTLPDRDCAAPLNSVGDDTVDPHGLATTSIIVAETNNKKGIAGITMNKNIKIMLVRVVSDQGYANYSNIKKGLDYIMKKKPNIVLANLSGWVDDAGSIVEMNQMFTELHQQGVVLIAGAGNDPKAGVGWPARYPPVLAVGGTGINGQRYVNASYGPELDLAAPAEEITTACYGQMTEDDDYCFLNGTSFAGPHVAAAAAILLAIKPDLTPDQIEEILEESTGQPYTEELGFGNIDLVYAMRRVMHTSYFPLVAK